MLKYSNFQHFITKSNYYITLKRNNEKLIKNIHFKKQYSFLPLLSSLWSISNKNYANNILKNSLFLNNGCETTIIQRNFYHVLSSKVDIRNELLINKIIRKQLVINYKKKMILNFYSYYLLFILFIFHFQNQSSKNIRWKYNFQIKEISEIR